jgi:hypothetical protein
METPCVTILNKQKRSFLFSLFCKTENGRVEQILTGVGEVDTTNGRGAEVGKGFRRVNMVQIHMKMECKWKNTC